jgi:N12 class adenine-specific DNA methylase
MNQTITLRPHQKDAVWREMSGGNTLLAHCVGAGKTFTMAAAGMKMKQARLIKKPMYVGFRLSAT